jgi:hypothetical protein
MHVIDVNNHTVTLYENVKELPIKRYVAFQKYVLLDSGVGGDIDSIGNHFSRLFQFLANRLIDEATEETKNLYYNLFMIMEEINPTSRAFACIVHKIDDEIITGFSEEDVKRTVEKLAEIEITQRHIEEYVDNVKKKSGSDLKLYFPDLFAEELELQFYQNIKARILAYEGLLDDENDEKSLKVIAEVDLFLAKMNKPNCFDSDTQQNGEIQLELQFENLCSSLESNGIPYATTLTAFEFYSRLAFLKRQTENLRKSNRVPGS